MVDFHSHILPGIDDGSSDFEESIKLIKEAASVGFTKIISTSHYMEGVYEAEEKERTSLLYQLEGKIEDENPSFKIPKLYLGSEIYVSERMIDFLRNKKASCINNTRYILFELPLNSKFIFAKEIIFKLIENGYKPIIAHPERYSVVKENIEYAKELKKLGVLFQSNYGSILGLYGREAKKTLKKLLKENLISFLGSDVHRTNQVYPYVPKALKKLEKIVPKEKLEELTTINAEKILKNEEILC